MKRVYNFSAGPSMLPISVLQKAADEMLCYGDSGMSVMEMSHRSKHYDVIIKEAEALLREIMNIPDNYKVLFLQGGASTQFAAVPMNLMTKNGKADYILSGQFSTKAYKQAQKYGDVVVAASSKDDNFSKIPETTRESFRPDADYVHVCFNNTIYGTKYNYIPDTGDIPLVADMSSCIISEPVDVSKFGLIYAGAQKNMAPAGVTIVIVREDLLDYAEEDMPTMLEWKTMAENDSMYNTPPAYGIYICGKVFKWLKKMGGLEAMKEHNEKKAAILYDFLDRSKLFKGTVEKKDRSLMNVVFVTGDADLDKKFVAEGKDAGLHNLGGHRSIGGMRASIYNAMPIEGVEALCDFIRKFEKSL